MFHIGDLAADETIPRQQGSPSPPQLDLTATQFSSLTVHKIVDWNGVTPDPAQTFQICITGPSCPLPSPNCQNAGYTGGELV